MDAGSVRIGVDAGLAGLEVDPQFFDLAYIDVGRDGSKGNAVRHGLMARSLFPVDLAKEIADLTAELTEYYVPTSGYEKRLVADMGRAGAQCDRCRNLIVVDLQRSIDRSALCWDDDRRVYVDQLATSLPKDPARVARALGRTKQGVDWLLENWAGLRGVLETNGTWNQDQRAVAFDLLGVRHEFRDASPKLPADASTETLMALVSREEYRLKARLTSHLTALDHSEQAMAASGCPFEEDASTKRLRKYEAHARREYLRARAELLESRGLFAAAGQAGDVVKKGPATAAPAPAPAAAATTTTLFETPPAMPRAQEGPAPRPSTSKAAEDFLSRRSRTDTMLVPAAPPDEDHAPDGPASLLEQELHSLDAVITPMPSTTLAASARTTVTAAKAEPAPRTTHAPTALVEPEPAPPAAATPPADPARPRRDRQRRLRRAQEKQARKAARRDGR